MAAVACISPTPAAKHYGCAQVAAQSRNHMFHRGRRSHSPEDKMDRAVLQTAKSSKLAEDLGANKLASMKPAPISNALVYMRLSRTSPRSPALRQEHCSLRAATQVAVRSERSSLGRGVHHRKQPRTSAQLSQCWQRLVVDLRTFGICNG